MFFTWRRRLAGMGKPRYVELTAATREASAVASIASLPPDDEAAIGSVVAAIELMLPGGVRLQVRAGFDAALLCQVDGTPHQCVTVEYREPAVDAAVLLADLKWWYCGIGVGDALPAIKAQDESLVDDGSGKLE